MYNSLKYAKILEEVGFTREQAEAQMQIMTETIETNLATKQDMKDLSLVLSQDLKDLKAELQSVKTNLETNLENKITQSEQRQTIKLGSIVTLAIGVAVTLAKLF